MRAGSVRFQIALSGWTLSVPVSQVFADTATDCPADIALD